MKKESILKIVFYFIIVLMLFFISNKINKYLDAKIQYESAECSDRAYIIYKGYDDQIPEYTIKDWDLRITNCAEIEAEYQDGF